MNKTESEQLGRSMVEMLGVLAIIGVLSVGGIAGYSKAMEKYNLNKLRDQFFQILHNLTTAVASGQETTQLANNNVIDALHILPQEMGKAKDCRHALGGRCYVVGVGSGYDITIRLQDLPQKACVEMSTLDLTSYSGTIYINASNRIEIDPSTCVTEDGEKTCTGSKLRSVPQAVKECRGKLNAVVFMFSSKL
ncbi:MAG: type II secretion system protein [Alphaproteobacteria bacterium]|nr:type II secretion system protein [Alphaproteobacteria bacterium]